MGAAAAALRSRFSLGAGAVKRRSSCGTGSGGSGQQSQRTTLVQPLVHAVGLLPADCVPGQPWPSALRLGGQGAAAVQGCVAATTLHDQAQHRVVQLAGTRLVQL